MNAIDYIYDSGLHNKNVKITLSLEDFLHYKEDGYRKNNPLSKMDVFNTLHRAGCTVSMNLPRHTTKVRLL